MSNKICINLDTLDLVEDQRNKGAICCFKLTDSVEVTDYDSQRMYELAFNKEKLLKAWNKARLTIGCIL